jgi:type III pantothenate kinase
MKPDIVVDVGNSLMKWGPCVTVPITTKVSLPADNPAAWQKQLESWKVRDRLKWAVSGVYPARRDTFAEWLRQRGDSVLIVKDAQQTPLSVQVDHPDKVGIDRLLNAVAANDRVQRAADIIIIDAGSAVTVDWVDVNKAFRGGAIFPGLWLMALALHDHTALLPLVEVRSANPELPGTSTTSAMEAGIYWAVAGAIKALVRQLTTRAGADRRREVFLTGGDAHLLTPVLDTDYHSWPTMTLEGLRLAAEALP